MNIFGRQKANEYSMKNLNEMFVLIAIWQVNKMCYNIANYSLKNPFLPISEFSYSNGFDHFGIIWWRQCADKSNQ